MNMTYIAIGAAFVAIGAVFAAQAKKGEDAAKIKSGRTAAMLMILAGVIFIATGAIAGR